MADENDSQKIVREITCQMKEVTRNLFEAYFIPRMERQLDLQMQAWLERIVEKKIEERFAFAIELLRSMNRSAIEPQYHEPPMNPKMPDGKS